MTSASRYVVFFGVILITACGSSEPNEDLAINPNTDSTKLLVAQRVYDDDRVPVGFYSEPTRNSGAFYSIQHVKASDLNQSAGDYEVCHDDFAMALSFSEQLNAGHPQSGSLTDTDENSRFFEFVRSIPGNVSQYRVERVFKCSYLDRSSYNPNTGAAGTANIRPLSESQLKTIAEYFWTFSEYNNVGSVVVSSDTQASTPNLGHTLSLARLFPDAGRNNCDYVELVDWQYESDQNDGELFSTETVVGGFSAEKTTAGVRICQ